LCEILHLDLGRFNLYRGVDELKNERISIRLYFRLILSLSYGLCPVEKYNLI